MSDPHDSPAVQVLANLRAWEQRGRGWTAYPYPVELEPPFRPFVEHWAWRPPALDDGRRPGVWASLFGSNDSVGPALPPGGDWGSDEPDPTAAPAREQVAELHVLLPPGFDLPPEAEKQILQLAQFATAPVSFELLGLPGSISVQFAGEQSDQPSITEHLATLAPEVGVVQRDGFLAAAWERIGSVPVVVDLGLANEFFRPLRGRRITRAELLAPLMAGLAGVAEGELAVVQILYAPARHPWADSILRAVHDNEGQPLFATGPELVRQAQEKIAQPLFACRIRLAARAGSRTRALQLLRNLLPGFSQLATPQGNELIALDSTGWGEDKQRYDLLGRAAHRPGMILNADELAALVHLPGSEIAHPKFERLTRRTKAAPEAVCRRGVLLGVNDHHGRRSEVRVSPEQRMRHTYVIGASGTGKSTLLLSMILQDIEAGQGVGVLDPHGDLIDDILGRIPESRTGDVVLLDPADEEYPVGINILSTHSELERTLLSSDLVGIFRRLSTSWGDQMNSVFANAILAMLESSEGGTLLELRRFLVDREYRGRFLQTVSDPEIVYYWQKEFPLLKGAPQAPILTRLDSFLRPKIVRNIVSQRERSLNFGEILDRGRIFLARLSHGAIGEENAQLLGAFLVSKLHQVALSRQVQEASTRRDFFLYADEFQHFATPSMASLLTGVRKYRLGLILAHQHLRQLGGGRDELVGAVLGSASTRVVFRVGDQDARALAEGFTSFEARDIQNLGTGEAIARVDRSDFDFNLRTAPVPQVDSAEASRRREKVVASSREQYAIHRSRLAPSAEAAPVPAPEPEVGPAALPIVGERSGASPTLPVQPRKREDRSGGINVQPGRGGQQHKYLQSLIRRFGEDRGFRVEIERPVLGGAGIVDVALEREGLSVAVEISVTTPLEHEVGNVQKCLSAGFDHVALILTDNRAVNRAQEALTVALPEASRERVQVLVPEEVVAFLDRLDVSGVQPQEQTVAGYKVSVTYKPAQEEGRGASKTIKDILARSLKRLKG